MSKRCTATFVSRSLWIGILVLALPRPSAAQQFALESSNGLKLKGVTVQAATLNGKKGVRIEPDSASRAAQSEPDMLAIIDGLQFSNGVIEVEAAGTPGEGAFASARGYVGVAFRVGADGHTYDAFYLRPTNGRVDDQLRRNHVTQYVSHPTWTWSKLRTETPGKYESYVDVVPNEWTKIRIEVQGDKAKLFVNDAPQPVLIVTDVKTGANGSGGVALWIGAATVGHFRNLRIERK